MWFIGARRMLQAGKVAPGNALTDVQATDVLTNGFPELQQVAVDRIITQLQADGMITTALGVHTLTPQALAVDLTTYVGTASVQVGNAPKGGGP